MKYTKHNYYITGEKRKKQSEKDSLWKYNLSSRKNSVHPVEKWGKFIDFASRISWLKALFLLSACSASFCIISQTKENPYRQFGKGLERTTRLELATSTLARWRSTRWATFAFQSHFLSAWIIILYVLGFVNSFFLNSRKFSRNPETVAILCIFFLQYIRFLLPSLLSL